MQRRIFIKNAGLLAGGSLFLKPMSFATGTNDFKTRMLRGRVGIFTEKGGTIGYFLGKEGTIVIDSQFPDTAPHLIAEVQKQNTAGIKYLLNTHHHGDHTGGNIAFKGMVDHVIAHANALANLKSVSEKNHSTDKQLFPDITFTDDYKLKLDDEKLKGFYFGAGHTNGDAVYHFEKANVMHVGDLMFNKRHPFVDRSAGANMQSWIKVLDDIYKKADKDTMIIFGHSLNEGEETGNRDDLKKFQAYLQKVLDFAASEIKKGTTKEAFIANTSIPGVTDWGGTGIERPLTAAYEELSNG